MQHQYATSKMIRAEAFVKVPSCVDVGSHDEKTGISIGGRSSRPASAHLTNACAISTILLPSDPLATGGNHVTHHAGRPLLRPTRRSDSPHPGPGSAGG